jgi:hypothetical protein
VKIFCQVHELSTGEPWGQVQCPCIIAKLQLCMVHTASTTANKAL